MVSNVRWACMYLLKHEFIDNYSVTELCVKNNNTPNNTPSNLSIDIVLSTLYFASKSFYLFIFFFQYHVTEWITDCK